MLTSQQLNWNKNVEEQYNAMKKQIINNENNNNADNNIKNNNKLSITATRIKHANACLDFLKSQGVDENDYTKILSRAYHLVKKNK